MDGRNIFREVEAERLEVDSLELSARLGGYCTACTSIADEYISALRALMKPRYAARLFDIERTDDGFLKIAGGKIYSEALKKNLQGAKRAYILVATLGVEADRYLKRMSAVSSAKHYIADGVASAFAEALANLAEREICEGLDRCVRFSPGYADFPISYQRVIAAAFSDERRLGVTLTDSYLMIPTKSISAVIGLKNEQKANNY